MLCVQTVRINSWSRYDAAGGGSSGGGYHGGGGLDANGGGGGGAMSTTTMRATGGGSPGVGHYAVSARRQTLAMLSTPLLVHFGAQTSARRRADQRVEVSVVEELEVDFMEGAVVGGVFYTTPQLVSSRST